MSIKDLFNKNHVNKIVSSKSLAKLGADAESATNVVVGRKEAETFIPPIDFASGSNFAIYGSAAKYYNDAIKRIYLEYPYDGSDAEVKEFTLSSSYLDRYVLDERYPKSTGYVIMSAAGWGTPVATLRAASGFYGAPASASYEYISFTGGPHTTRAATDPFASAFTGSHNSNNIYDLSKRRGSSLSLHPASGSTAEFWLNKGSFTTANTQKEVIFDVWNGIEDATAADYGRFIVELSASGPAETGQDVFRLTYLSGTTGITRQAIGSTAVTTASVADGTWNHYAVSLASSSGDGLVGRLYVNGELNDTQAFSGIGTLNEITGALEGQIGALRFTPPGLDAYPVKGWGKLDASLDEFRYWKTRRTSEGIGRFWWDQVGGGANTDEANTQLGVYYRFNEGITGDTDIDSTVLDYSGRISNGTFTGYAATARNTGSAIVSSSAATFERANPIIYSTHPDVDAVATALVTSGSIYDGDNNSAFMNRFPAWIIESDTSGDLGDLTQILASYFDKLHAQIKEVPKLKNTQYLSSSAKPYPFTSHLIESAGLLATDIFVDSTVMEAVQQRDDDRDFILALDEIKNRIYQNIYNNLVYIYKSKGTEKAFRNLIHCYGVGEELIRLNTYGNNITYELKDNFRAGILAKKAADFSRSDRFGATVYQYTASSNANSVSFISGTVNDPVDNTVADYIPITLESEIVFPIALNLCCGITGSFSPEFITSSLFGMHSADEDAPYQTTWPSNDYADLRVVAIKESIQSTDVTFKLTSSVSTIPQLTSSLFTGVYDNTKWNFAVRILNEKYPIGDFVTGSTTSGSSYAATPYRVEFYGVNNDVDVTQNQFYLTGTVTSTDGLNLLRSPKRVFGGAHRVNFTGSEILQSSDVKLSYIRYWSDYVPNATIDAHARDPGVYGAPSASLNAFVTQNSLTGTYIPEKALLALDWNFYDVTGSDASGQFTVADYSSGSAELQSRYGWLGKIVQAQSTGRGDYFPASSQESVDKIYIPTAKQEIPEVVQSAEMVRLLDSDEEFFTRDQRPIDYFFSIEKSMSQVISDEMIKMFGTIQEFNRLIGDPVNRYRQQYKLMEKARSMFFEGVENSPDLDKFIDFYKWIDSSLNTFLLQLVPASANASDTITTLVESHVLERNKYWTKYPSLEGLRLAPEGITSPSLLGYSEDGFPPSGLPCTRTYFCEKAVACPSSSSPLGNSSPAAPGYKVLYDASTTLTQYDDFTFSTWLSSSEASALTTTRYLFGIGSDGPKASGGGHFLRIDTANKLRFTVGCATTTGEWITDSAIDMSLGWHHIGLSYADGDSDALLYIDGAEVAGSFTTSPVGAIQNLVQDSTLLCTRNNSAGNIIQDTFFYSGSVAEMSFWGAKLTGPQLAEIHSQGGTNQNPGAQNLVNHSAYSDLVSWWRMGDGAGDGPADQSGGASAVLVDQKSTNDADPMTSVSGMSITTLATLDLEEVGGGTYTGVCSPDPGNQAIHQQYWQQLRPRDESPLATGDATLDAAREALRKVEYPARERTRLVRVGGGLGVGRSSPRRGLYAGINYSPNKNRELMTPMVAPNSSVDSAGNPLNILQADDSGIIQLQDVTASAPVELRKKFLPFKFTSNRGSSVLSADHAAPFTLVSSSVATGYNRAVALSFMSGTAITNLHSDTTLGSNDIPLQGPFSLQHVGGREARHININRYNSDYSTTNNVDDPTVRAEAWQLLLGERYSAASDTHILALTPADYAPAAPTAYPAVIRQKATRLRNVGAKRPLNVRNIKYTTASVNLGNYSKEYQIVQTAGRSANNSYFVSSSGAPLPSLFINTLKETTNPNSLVGIRPAISGNYFGTNNGNISDFFETTTNYSVGRSGSKSQNNFVIVNRFCAPGAPEVQSLGFLDIMAKEKSVYNAMPFRNLMVRASGSGETDTIRSVDQLEHRRGLGNLLSLHAGRFGYDPTFGSIPSEAYITKPSYQKNNRNTRKRIGFTGPIGYAGYGTTATASTYDNAYVNYSIPRSDLQYSWITGSYEYSRILGHAWNDSFVSSSEGDHQAIDFVSASNISFSGSIKVDFVGMNTLVVDPVDVVSNIVSSSTNTYTNGDFNFSLSGSEVLNGLLLHRNGPYGINSWKQIRAGDSAVARALRKKNIISFVKKNSYNYPLDVVSSVPTARYTEFEQFTESPVVSKFFPVVQAVVANNLNSDGTISQRSVRVSSPYANNLCAFSHIALNNRYNISERSPQNYDSIKDLYLRNRDDDAGSPVNNFDFLLYRENVYPSLVNAYSSSIRVRQNYVNTFWRNKRADRLRDDVTSFGALIPAQSMWSLDADSDFLTRAITTRFNSDGGAGALQNDYCQIGPHNWQVTASAQYARRHTIENRRSVIGPEGLALPVTGAAADGTIYDYTSFDIDTQMFGGQALWQAGAQSGRNPWYNSYEDYVQELRLKGKDYSIVPAFRISDHVENYVKSEGGDFLANNLQAFQVSGGVEDKNVSDEAEFFKTYSNSDFLKFFQVVRDDHSDIASPSSIGFRCKALLKFLPYNGFYPSERTLDLATMFSSSYGHFINYTVGGDPVPAATSSLASFTAFLNPMFAPGLMYNTIKSGIAVDYPIFTGAVGLHSISNDTGGGTMYLSGSGISGAPSSTGRFDLRLPFEALLDPESYLTDVDVSHMETHASATLNVTASWDGTGDPLYRMMANNFFAEVANFYLPEENFTTLVSRPDTQWDAAEKDKVYAARVKVRKSYNNVTVRTGSLGYRNPLTPADQWRGDLHESFTMYSRPSAFGPPVGGGPLYTKAFASPQGFNPCFTPPYYYGESWAHIFFTAPHSGSFTIDDLLSPSNLAVSYLRIGDGWDISGSGKAGTSAKTLLFVDDIEYNSMQLDASFNLFGKASMKAVTYDPATGEPTSMADAHDERAWVLQTKFETPMLNFADVSVTDPTYGSASVARGMWHQYGVVPDSPEKGIFFSVEDIPAAYISGALGGDPDLTGSLADLVGLPTDEKRLGEVARSKVIREAIVAVPYTEQNSERRFFAIPRNDIDAALSNHDSSNNSVQQMVDAMKRYVFPPRMDFITNPDAVSPFAMYIFEFEHTLNRADLVDMWQGLPPRIGQAFDTAGTVFTSGKSAPSNEIVQESVITHPLITNELLSSEDMSSNIRWMVFKVKQKASKNYFSKVIKDQLNVNDNFDRGRAAQIGREDSTRVTDPKYGYNWPYDFFSLVELVKIDAEVEISPNGSGE